MATDERRVEQLEQQVGGLADELPVGLFAVEPLPTVEINDGQMIVWLQEGMVELHEAGWVYRDKAPLNSEAWRNKYAPKTHAPTPPKKELQ